MQPVMGFHVASVHSIPVSVELTIDSEKGGRREPEVKVAQKSITVNRLCESVLAGQASSAKRFPVLGEEPQGAEYVLGRSRPASS